MVAALVQSGSFFLWRRCGWEEGFAGSVESIVLPAGAGEDERGAGSLLGGCDGFACGDDSAWPEAACGSANPPAAGTSQAMVNK